jgi:hypothetical protein
MTLSRELPHRCDAIGVRQFHLHLTKLPLETGNLQGNGSFRSNARYSAGQLQHCNIGAQDRTFLESFHAHSVYLLRTEREAECEAKASTRSVITPANPR